MYPKWGEAIGWCVCVASLFSIPFMMIIKLHQKAGSWKVSFPQNHKMYILYNVYFYKTHLVMAIRWQSFHLAASKYCPVTHYWLCGSHKVLSII